MATPDTGRPRLDARRAIFTSFALRSLRENRTHTMVTIIGIALSCALITAIFTSVATLYSGLLHAELASEGAWQLNVTSTVAGDQGDIADDPRVDAVYVHESYGAALMPKSFEGYWGRYLTVEAWPTADRVSGLVPLPIVVEGRAPEHPGEIVLDRDLKGATVEGGQWLYDGLPASDRDASVPRAAWEGQIEVGTALDLVLGRRSLLDADGRERPLPADSSLYIEPGEQGDAIAEWLGGATPVERYTVVGFFGGRDDYLPDFWTNDAGHLGFVAEGSLAPMASETLVATNLTDRSQIDALVREYSDAPHPTAPDESAAGTWALGDTLVEVHDALLRYQGITGESAIWSTLYSIAGILSCVVAVASVSLIYNSFAISVTERTRRFGLLASLGASRRQLRRTVFIEAGLLAAAGIPIGLAIGLAGTWVVFRIAGEGVGMLIDQYAFGAEGIGTIIVSPAVLAVSAALAASTVLVSAAVPAIRASRVPAIDAVRLSRDVRTRPLRRRRGALACRLDALRLRFLGVPGLLASRNLARAGSRARVAVASLAVSAALIIVAGSISHYLGYLTRVADRGGSGIEVYLDRVLSQDETAEDGVEAIDAAYDALAAVDGARGEGYVISVPLFGAFEPGMVDLTALYGEDGPEQAPVDADGTVYAPLSLLFVDNASWKRMIEHDGLDPERYCDPDEPVAIGLNGTQAMDGTRYVVLDNFERAGTATLFTHIANRGRDLLASVDADPVSGPRAVYELYRQPDDVEVDEYGNVVSATEAVPLDEVLLESRELPVGAITDDPPHILREDAPTSPTLILPSSALPALATESEDLQTTPYANPMGTPFALRSLPGSYDQSLTAQLSFDVGDPRAAESGMRGILQTDLSGSEWYRSWLNNNAAAARSGRIVRETIQLFANCFMLITGTIAVANVFNTLANSIALRRREFAMLESVGMDRRAFLRMIALECLSYAWRGLALGLALGAGVTYLIYRSMGIAFEGLDFSLPLGSVIGAICLVAAVLALSTIYALRKARADSIVAILREDSI